MKTLEYLRARSRDPDFPLQVVGAGLLTALGGPLVVGPVATVVAADALMTALGHAPKVLEIVARTPINALNRWKERTAAEAERDRIRADRANSEARREREEAIDTERSQLAANEAQWEVVRFYGAHRSLLDESIPYSLFRGLMRTRFSSAMSGEQAWHAARELIQELLPLVAAGRERQKTVASENRAEAEKLAAAEKAERDLENSRHALGCLTQWYQREKAKIEELMEDGEQREIVLMGLYERYDQLLKEALQEMKP